MRPADTIRGGTIDAGAIFQTSLSAHSAPAGHRVAACAIIAVITTFQLHPQHFLLTDLRRSRCARLYNEG